MSLHPQLSSEVQALKELASRLESLAQEGGAADDPTTLGWWQQSHRALEAKLKEAYGELEQQRAQASALERRLQENTSQAGASQDLLLRLRQAEKRANEAEVRLSKLLKEHKELVHAVAEQHGLQASFLPKPYPEFAGSGCHLHFSLWRDGLNLSAQPPETGGTNAQFMAGILSHLPALMALTTPSRNSFARLGRHLWSGAFACWGYDNREAGLRVPTHPDGLSHFELKTHDASANPYLALGAVIAAGLDGIAQEFELPSPVEIDPGLLSETELQERGIASLPTCMQEAMGALEADEALREALDEDLYRSYLAVKREEQRSIESLSVVEEIELLRGRY